MSAPGILLKGGRVIDGTGAPARCLDVLVRGDRIAWMGEPGEAPPLDAAGAQPASACAACEVVDVADCVVAPGFIDAHAHGDPFATPDFETAIAMGVTTLCLGQDGESPAAVQNLVPWLNEAQAAHPAPNLAFLAGHATLRELAGAGSNPHPPAAQLQLMRNLLDRALEAGCLGLTTGLEYPPGSAAGIEELAGLAEVVGRRGGLVMSHIRNEDDDKIDDAVDELIEQGRRGRCAVHVSHVKVVHGRGAARAEALLARLADARERLGVRVTADQYPYTASCTTIGLIFPEWAKGGEDFRRAEAGRREELAAWLRERVRKRGGPEATRFTTPPWTGLTLAQAAESKNKPFEDLLIDDIGPEGASAAYFVIDAECMERLLVDPNVMISSDGGPPLRHPRSAGTFARILCEFVQQRGLLTLEEAVRKMTGLTARTLGLDAMGRGQIAPGFYADLVIFDPARVRDTATYEDPMRLAEGMDFVMINGRWARFGGAATGSRPGRILRRPWRQSPWAP